MQQRKEIYEKALGLLEMQLEKYTCTAIFRSSEGVDFFENVIGNFKELMLFKPYNLDARHSWFDNQLEREICLDFCILFCNDKMFKDA
jgi:hypothetical protein